jgi:hypothetical protein
MRMVRKIRYELNVTQTSSRFVDFSLMKNESEVSRSVPRMQFGPPQEPGPPALHTFEEIKAIVENRVIRATQDSHPLHVYLRGAFGIANK